MSSLLRNGQSDFAISGNFKGFLAALAALGLSGCSADIARFDFPSASLTGNSTGGIPAPSEPMRVGSNTGGDNTAVAGASSEGGAYFPPAPNRDSAVKMTALPDPVFQNPVPAPVYAAPAASRYQAPGAATPFQPANTSPVTEAAATGEQIEVRPGDTLFGLSKRHKVSLNELMTTNGLTSPALKPGQKLSLPSGKMAAKTPERLEAPAIVAAEAPADWTGAHTVKTGESLYGIARQNKVKLADLQRYNGITDVRRVKPGAVLKIPGSNLSAPVVAEAPAPVAAPAITAPIRVSPAAENGVAPAQPTILNSGRTAPDPMAEQKVAELKTSGTATDAPSASAQGSGSVADAGKLRWPVKGKVIAPFGPRPDGTHNDGVNLAVPMGTEVHAAESGTVAYAGSELKGYGNLVLLRHDNGMVTAYAHGDELLVKRGDKVKRGQVIAKAGKTGQVDQPQLHFEVRQGQKPVDPTPFLEKL